MKYIYIDGDNIGLKIEQSFLNNDEENLRSINSQVIHAVSQISKYLEQSQQEIVFAAADGIIAKGDKLVISKLLDQCRNSNKSLTFSIGVGQNLRQCYLALRYAKSFQKNIAVEYSNESEFTIIES